MTTWFSEYSAKTFFQNSTAGTSPGGLGKSAGAAPARAGSDSHMASTTPPSLSVIG